MKIAFRNIKRHKGYSFINIVGLAIGMACSILILSWVQDELSFDRFHNNSDNIYRIAHEEESGKYKSTATPIPLSPYLPELFPEIEHSSRYSNGIAKYSIKYEEKTFVEDIGIVEASFFKMFSFPLVRGSSVPWMTIEGGSPERTLWNGEHSRTSHRSLTALTNP